MRPLRTSLALVLVLLGSSGVSAQVVRVSVSTSGTEANGISTNPDISGTGRFVVFASGATNLVANDTNERFDVFIRDRDSDTDGVFDEPGEVATTRVTAPGGIQADAGSSLARITPDGRYVLFVSDATNLVPGLVYPTTPHAQLYRLDRQTGAILLVSVSTAGFPCGDVLSARMSDDGRIVAFWSNDARLADGLSGPFIYVHDVDAGTTTRISDPRPPSSVIPIGLSVSYDVSAPDVSADGRLVAFAETRSTWGRGLPITTTGTVVVVDRVTGVVRRDLAPGTAVFLTAEGDSVVASTDLGATIRQRLDTGERLTSLFAIVRTPTALAPDRRTLATSGGLVDIEWSQFTPAFDLREGAFARGGRDLVFTSSRTTVVTGDTNGVADVFVLDLPRFFDQDADTLDDRWETFFGLSTASGAGVDGAGGDPDGDGLTNADEQTAGSHPRGTVTRYFAEGTASAYFRTRFAVANPAATAPATVVVRLERRDGTAVSQARLVRAGLRETFEAGAVAGLDSGDFSTVVESDAPIVADRLVSWSGIGAGSHAETAAVAPASSWFLAEGTTVLGFQLFYLLQNPQATAATATVRYLLPSGAPVVRSYELPPHSRTTIHVNAVPALDATDVSADITSTLPIVVERAMYRSTGAEVFALGHAAAGIPQASTTWFLAEGSTGAFFDTYVLLANPSAQAAQVAVDFLSDDGVTVSRTYQVGANSRFSIFADAVAGLEATSFGARITSTVPIVVERAMYWAGGFFDYYEGHASAATAQTGSWWVLAEGEVGGPDAAQTYVLVANTSATPVTASITVMTELTQSRFIPRTATVTVPGNGRTTVPLGPIVYDGSALTDYVRVGADVREVGSTPTGALVVEGALYRNVGSQLWGAGASLPATRVP